METRRKCTRSRLERERQVEVTVQSENGRSGPKTRPVFKRILTWGIGFYITVRGIKKALCGPSFAKIEFSPASEALRTRCADTGMPVWLNRVGGSS